MTMEDDDTIDIEAKARAQGWFPEEEWDEERAEAEGRRKPAKFLTAQEFLDRVSTNMPMLHERLNKSQGQVHALEKKVKELTSIVTDQQRMNIEAVKRARAQGRAELEQELRTAVAEGDLDRHDKVQADIKKLDEEERKALVEEAKVSAEPEPAEQPANKPDPETLAWVDANPWFLKDNFLHDAMIREHNKVIQQSPAMATGDQLERAKRTLMARYPEEFGVETNRRTAQIEGGGLNPSISRGSSVEARFAALPKADRDVYERQRSFMAKQKKPIEFTKAEFLEGYGA